MRKLKTFYFAMMAIVSLSFLTSCGDNNEPNPKATITFDPSATNDQVSLGQGSPYHFKVVVTSADKLKSFKSNVSSGGTTIAEQTVTSFPGTGYSMDITDTLDAATPVGTQIVYTFTATTSKDEVTTRTYTINVISDMATYQATILGNQQAAAGSFLSLSDGSVLNSSSATNSSGKVDVVYYYSTGGSLASNHATLAAPSNTDAQTVFTIIPSWATKNATSFKLISTTGAAYDNVTAGSMIGTAYGNSSATAGSDVKNLAQGNVVGFQTASGKFAIAKVTNITLAGAVSQITLDIKAQR